MAQVSVGTASNVLNNPELVAPSTRARVLEAIQGTGFVRSTAAQQLRVGESRTVGVVLLDFANPLFTEMVRGASMCCATRATGSWSAQVTSRVSVSGTTSACSRNTESTAC